MSQGMRILVSAARFIGKYARNAPVRAGKMPISVEIRARLYE